MSSSSQPLVSVVTPVYNESAFLPQCIESILAQSYQNWEYIVVNNCSTDDTGEIARRYAARDSRIRVHDNQEFLRAVPNYNNALRLISPTSKYCKIVFGDDWIFPECLEQMVALAEEYPSVGIVGAYGLQGTEVMWAGLPYPSRLVSGREVCRRLFLDEIYVFGGATALLYRADLVRSHDPFYNEANLHSDMEICVSLLRDCDFGFVHKLLTYTREERPGSLRAVSSNLNTYAAGNLYNLVAFGHDFLNDEEYQTCLERNLDVYYANLAGGLVRGRDKKFWDYHKGKLNDMGLGFRRTRLARMVLQKILHAVANPGAMIAKGWQIAQDIRTRRGSEVKANGKLVNHAKRV